MWTPNEKDTMNARHNKIFFYIVAKGFNSLSNMDTYTTDTLVQCSDS